MKKVLAIACLLALATCGAAMGAADNWALYIFADDGSGGNYGVRFQFGVKPTAVDGLDTFDGIEAPLAQSQPNTKWATAKIGDGVYSKDYLSPTPCTDYPNSEKKWDLRVAGLSGANLATPIRLRFQTTTTALLPPETLGGVALIYKLRMVDNKGVAGAPANGTEWVLPAIPNTANTYFYDVLLPTVRISQSTSAAMIAEGYKMEVIQTIPEPGSLLVLGTGLAGLAGFAFRRRRT